MALKQCDIQGQSANAAATTLLLSHAARLTFDCRECLLPPVPLGMKSTATFYIINNGYDNLELKYKLPADEGHLPMEVEFPEGTIIGALRFDRRTASVASAGVRLLCQL